MDEGARGTPPTIVLAVLTVGGRYALQHRDDVPTVAAPGRWALFGGGAEQGETPEAAIRREVREELGLDVSDWRACSGASATTCRTGMPRCAT